MDNKITLDFYEIHSNIFNVDFISPEKLKKGIEERNKFYSTSDLINFLYNDVIKKYNLGKKYSSIFFSLYDNLFTTNQMLLSDLLLFIDSPKYKYVKGSSLKLALQFFSIPLSFNEVKFKMFNLMNYTESLIKMSQDLLDVYHKTMLSLILNYYLVDTVKSSEFVSGTLDLEKMPSNSDLGIRTTTFYNLAQNLIHTISFLEEKNFADFYEKDVKKKTSDDVIKNYLLAFSSLLASGAFSKQQLLKLEKPHIPNLEKIQNAMQKTPKRARFRNLIS